MCCKNYKDLVSAAQICVSDRGFTTPPDFFPDLPGCRSNLLSRKDRSSIHSHSQIADLGNDLFVCLGIRDQTVYLIHISYFKQ